MNDPAHTPKENRPEPAGRLRVGLIGGGVISEQHLRYLNAAPGAVVASVCDLSPALARFASEQAGGAASYTDLEKMLAEIQPDVVHVLTPPHTHVAVVGSCLRAGAHVIVEKPVAPSNAEFRELWKLAGDSGRALIEDQNYRFNDATRWVENQVAAGRIGKVEEVEVRLQLQIRSPGGRYGDENLPHPSHRLPAGVLHEFVTHLCYLALRFLPSVDHVSPVWNNHGGGNLFKYDDLDALVVGDSVHARIRFSARCRPDCFSLIVRGDRGTLETDLFNPYRLSNVSRGLGQQLDPIANRILGGLALVRGGVGTLADKLLQRGAYDGLQVFLDESYRALLGNGTPPVSFEDMDRASRLVDALLEVKEPA